jgi:hypothetical protein
MPLIVKGNSWLRRELSRNGVTFVAKQQAEFQSSSIEPRLRYQRSAGEMDWQDRSYCVMRKRIFDAIC